MDLARRCEIRASKMYAAGWYTTSGVLERASQRLRELEDARSALQIELQLANSRLMDIAVQRLRSAEN